MKSLLCIYVKLCTSILYCVYQAEAEHEEKYFGALEKRERMEDKMAAITEVQVTLFHCAQVNVL